jgi:hypothetical protein
MDPRAESTTVSVAPEGADVSGATASDVVVVGGAAVDDAPEPPPPHAAATIAMATTGIARRRMSAS